MRLQLLAHEDLRPARSGISEADLAVRSVTPAASAACITDQVFAQTRSTTRRRPIGLTGL
jgi:hypothetical protein